MFLLCRPQAEFNTKHYGIKDDDSYKVCRSNIKWSIEYTAMNLLQDPNASIGYFHLFRGQTVANTHNGIQFQFSSLIGSKITRKI